MWRLQLRQYRGVLDFYIFVSESVASAVELLSLLVLLWVLGDATRKDSGAVCAALEKFQRVEPLFGWQIG